MTVAVDSSPASVAVKERPILFSGPMVRAILEGKKTVTRRVVVSTSEPKIPPVTMEPWFVDDERQTDDHGCPCWVGSHPDYPASTNEKWFSCNQGKSGDVLWVRETFSKHPYGAGYIYRATDPGWDSECVGITWRPSIFMPKEACRLKLRVTDVRVERLQEITPEQARAEGVNQDTCPCKPSGNSASTVDWVEGFKRLWDDINGKRGFGWDVNPHVWVVEFERI